MENDPGAPLVLENVLEPEPTLLLDIVNSVNDPRLRLCLDVGHANAYSKQSAMEGLDQGSIPMRNLLLRADRICPGVSCTFELTETMPAVKWLQENHLI